jgi:penicillin-binding protein 2
LAEIVDVQPRDRKRFRKLMDESKNFETLPLRTRLSDEEVARFAVNRYRFPGVEIKARLFRQYPYGEVAAHVVGYIGRINDHDVERIAKWDDAANYKGSDYMGKVGVELSYERELHGTTGWEQVEVDAGGRAVRTLSRTPPSSGNNLRLSIDIKLQESRRPRSGIAAVRWSPSIPPMAISSPSSRGRRSIRISSSTASIPPIGQR